MCWHADMGAIMPRGVWSSPRDDADDALALVNDGDAVDLVLQTVSSLM